MDNLVFGDDAAGQAQARDRDRVVRTIRSYAIPRMTLPTTPLLVVFAGPTGAGKSTLVNSVSGLEVAETGPLRPTTTAPVVLAADGSGYERLGEIACEVVEGRAPILASMTLVDTPDLDSTSIEHRAAAEIMIDNADVVVFVSSALRYADLVPWEVLRRARSRGAPLIHVLNRVSSGAAGALTDYRSRLVAEGADGDIVVVHEHHLAGSPLVPSVAVRALRRRLMSQVKKSQAERAEIVRSVLWVTLGQARDLIAAAELEAAEAGVIERMLGQAFTPDFERIRAAGSGTVEVGYDTGPLANARLRRVRSWMRRRAPGAESIEAARRRVSETLATAVAIDLRVAIEDGRAVTQDQRRSLYRVGMSTQATIIKAIDSWWMLLEEMSRTAIGPRDVTAHLLGVAALQAHPGLEPVIAAVLPETDPLVVIDGARQALVWALEPVYASVRNPLAFAAAKEATPAEEVERARTVVAEVVARSAFADA